MKSTTNLISLFLLFSITTFAQDSDLGCSTKDADSAQMAALPWYGNNAFIDNFKPYTEREPQSGERVRHFQSGLNGAVYNIPVKAWIYEGEDQAVALPLPEHAAEAYINDINEGLEANGASIRLYLLYHEMTLIRNGDYYVATDFGGERMMEEHHVPFYMNIHFIRDSNGDIHGDGFGGKANKPWNSYRYSFIVTTRYNGNPLLLSRDEIVSTFVHELGHTFGLEHTHRGRGISRDSNGDALRCYQEPVSRANRQSAACLFSIGKLKCAINGDALCSTAGDPELQDDERTDPNFVRIDPLTNDCFYENPTQDRWNETWQPMVRNYMSYSERLCRDEFTRQQINVMYFFIENYRVLLSDHPTPQYFYVNPHVDRYENDNFWQNANEIDIARNEVQLHSLHYNPRIQNSLHRDKDWVTFTATAGQELTVATTPSPSGDIPTEMTVRVYRELFNDVDLTWTPTLIDEVITTDGQSEITLTHQSLPRLGDRYYVEIFHSNVGTTAPPRYLLGVFDSDVNLFGSGLLLNNPSGGPSASFNGFTPNFTGTNTGTGGAAGDLAANVDGFLCNRDFLHYRVNASGTLAGANLTYDWQLTERVGNWVSLVPYGNSAQVIVFGSNSPNDRRVDVTLTVRDAAGQALYSFTREFWIDDPTGFPILMPSQPNRQFCYRSNVLFLPSALSHYEYYSVLGVSGATHYLWYINNRLAYVTINPIGGITGAAPWGIRAMRAGTNTIYVEAYNPCGREVNVQSKRLPIFMV